MGQALYRKYRSKSLSEIVGQEHITATLDQAIKSGRISHAYLFTGPRGVGKTSIARILAHEINQLAYTDDSTHMDIIEIDAASNRGIEEIRDLREKVFTAPTSAKYKVYIIDEVHMLTTYAFNALLKTLEEPPAHVVFILATTNASKLPETIVSRTQRYSFRPVERDKVIAHLKDIAKAEKIKISDDALGMIADHGEGSFRDSISLLDQASSIGEAITLAEVQNLLGIAPAEAIIGLFDSLVSQSSASDMARQLSELQDQGFQAAAIAKQLAGLIRADIISKIPKLDKATGLQILTALIEVPVAHDPERFLEITLLKSSGSSESVAKVTLSPSIDPVPPKKTAPTSVPAQEVVAEPKLTEPEKVPVKATKTEEVPKTQSSGVANASLWSQILNALKSKHNTLYGVIRMAHPTFSDDSLQLAFAFAFHQKRISDSKNQIIIADIIEQLSGQKLRIICVLDKQLAVQPYIESAPETPSKAADSPEALSAINNIFGGGEVI